MEHRWQCRYGSGCVSNQAGGVLGQQMINRMGVDGIRAFYQKGLRRVVPGLHRFRWFGLISLHFKAKETHVG
jgi:hypothetical protein